jgi:hypothetical protein
MSRYNKSINPSAIGGGAASMVMSFSSGTIKHVETTSGNYASLAHFIYGGAGTIGSITNFNVNAWMSQNGNGDVRLVDLSNGNIIAELIAVGSQLESNVQSMGTITNLPLFPTVIEVQGRRTVGPGAAKLRIGSLEIQY